MKDGIEPTTIAIIVTRGSEHALFASMRVENANDDTRTVARVELVLGTDDEDELAPLAFAEQIADMVAEQLAVERPGLALERFAPELVEGEDA